jgi:hypothetical protein
MVGDGHLSTDGGVESEGKVSWTCSDTAIDSLYRSVGLGEETIVEFVTRTTCLREYREVS